MSTIIDSQFLHVGQIPWSSVIRATAILTIGYTLYGAIWRLYLSPVAHVPGPWLAKLTFWNEFYYDVILGGQYTWQLEKYHAKYGPVIRINPYEIHVLDKDFLDELYVGHSKRKSNKWAWTMRLTGLPEGAMFSTLEHDMHRARREPWNPYFSKLSVSRAQSHIQDLIDKLCDKFTQAGRDGTPVTMIHAYACLTIDIITEYTFPEGYNYLDRPGFDPVTHDAYSSLAEMTQFFKHFRGLAPTLQAAMPMIVAKYLAPGIYSILQNEASLVHQTEAVLAQRKRNESTTRKEISGRPSLIEALLDSKLPDSDKVLKVLASNALVVIGAGTLTTAQFLKHATFHILANPPIHSRFLSELESAIPDPSKPPTLRELESIDYLTAIMHETLRNMRVPPQRLQRIFPDTDLYYKNSIKLPAGTPIGMTGCLIHDDPALFPDPYSYNPDRWLPLATNGQRLLKYFAPFGRGSRNCVGMELAKAEMLMTLTTVFRRFGRGMKLLDTERERDVDVVRDYFFALASKESNGVVVEFGK